MVIGSVFPPRWNINGFGHLRQYEKFGFPLIDYIIVHMTVHFFVWCVNGKEIHKYLGYPYTCI